MSDGSNAAGPSMMRNSSTVTGFGTANEASTAISPSAAAPATSVDSSTTGVSTLGRESGVATVPANLGSGDASS
ncbi:hypothetical protein AGABI1DRAFT_115499, partial [Agaricus bisporus var. burnettii JB137-S8]